MGIQKNAITIIGEGPTEFYYIQSLVDDFRGISIKPDYPKHTSMNELGKKIAKCIDEGYRYVLCIIDMDNKGVDSEMEQYKRLKRKYDKPVIKKKKDIHCEIKFYETHLCTELFFYFYFRYTTHCFVNQEELIQNLNDFCKYEKSIDFFRKCKGLHSYFEKNGGSLETAIKNAAQSLDNKNITGSAYTYSELGEMFNFLNKILGIGG